MPDWIRGELVSCGLIEAYEARPDYQRNDYLGWISQAKLETTRRKRLDQMLDELERGGVYMRMAWHG
ncbi:YdeI/OmpD-associated family protein [Aminobacter anthyllidis]